LLLKKKNVLKFMIMLVASKVNKASMNIARECERLGLKVHYCEEDVLFIKELPEADAYIILSTHKSESEMPCLTSHFPGNFGTAATHGGNPGELAGSYPTLQKIYMRSLNSLKKELAKPELEKYQVVIEATHHGPTHFKAPVLFVEIGSCEKEWNEKAAAELVAAAVKKTLGRIKDETFIKPAIAFGGTHYPDKFTKIIVEGEYAIGHVLPKYQRENLSEEMMDQMFEKSIEKPKYCIIDYKGINQKQKIIDWAKNKGLEVVKV
jgi:D-aminoacyl-tRNA deacylase